MPLPLAALRSNVEFVRNYFRTNPAATVREAVRAASQARQGLHWEEVARVHREMLPELRTMGAALAQQVPKLAVKPHPPLPQKPRGPVEILREAVPLAPPRPEAAPKATQPAAETHTQETPPHVAQGEEMAKHKKTHRMAGKVPLLEISPAEILEGQQPRGNGTEVRRRYLNTYLDKYPEATAAQCMTALDATFGRGLGLGYVLETVKLAAAARAAPPVPAPAPARAAAPQPALEAAPAPTPSPAPLSAPEARQAVEWGPPTAQLPLPAGLDEALRRLAGEFRSLCETHQLAEAALVWDAERKLKAQYSRVQRATLEV